MILRENIVLVFIIAIYSLAISSIISWGIPNLAHPFTYNMDEWHQLQAVRDLFRYGTPNIPGAAHGSIFQFLLSGIYLIPFIIFRVVNPFIIHSSIDNLEMQEKLFVVMRSNTLLFGILSMIVLIVIVKKYLKTDSILTTLLLVGTPIWLTLSSYFKYDVALIFWISLSILFLLRYAKKPTLKNYLFSAIPCALAFATKVSAIPMLVIYVFSFFLFTQGWNKKYKQLMLGIAVFLSVFIILGIPDLIFRLSDYSEYLSSNLITSAQRDSNYLLGVSNKWIYILFVLFPITFGHLYYILFLIAFIYLFFKFARRGYLNINPENKNDIFLLFSLVIFLLSLIPLGLGASGNRLLVLLPFFVLITSRFIVEMMKKFGKYRIRMLILLSILILLQLRESSVVIYQKYSKSVLQISSDWIVENIPKDTIIGIENIPIYQTLPDVVLKEYYLNISDKYAKTNYKYEVVSASTMNLPEVIVITNRHVHEKYLIKSPKKNLLDRLRRDNYKVVGEFRPSSDLYHFFGNDRDYYLSGLNFVLPVTIYERG